MPDEAPYRNFNFLVRVDGLPETGFTQVVIPGSRIEIVEYRTGPMGALLAASFLDVRQRATLCFGAGWTRTSHSGPGSPRCETAVSPDETS
jgi:hypothetical protein